VKREAQDGMAREKRKRATVLPEKQRERIEPLLSSHHDTDVGTSDVLPSRIP